MTTKKKSLCNTINSVAQNHANDNKVTVTHMILEKVNFSGIKDARMDEERAEIINRDLDLELIKNWIKTVGGDSDWHLREEQSDKNLIERIHKASSHLWELQYDSSPIGFAMCAEHIGNIRDHFNDDSLPEGGAIHFYKFGLDQQNRLKKIGLGGYFASLVTNELLKHHDTIVMNTRRSNAVDSVRFWKKLGFTIFMEEEIQSDIIINE